MLPCAALAIGTFFPAIPYLGTAGSALLPLLAPQIAVVALLGGALALAARRLGARRTGDDVRGRRAAGRRFGR